METLDDETYDAIQKLCEEGNELADDGVYAEALEKFEAAFELIPEPRTTWEASTWILTAMGDVYFLSNNFQAGVDNLLSAMNCPGAIGNPFIHLRLGECLFEIGMLDKAADELTRAYAIEGEEIFEGSDPKYFDFLKTRISIT